MRKRKKMLAPQSLLASCRGYICFVRRNSEATTRERDGREEVLLAFAFHLIKLKRF
jgi:hypothetical protein